MVIWRRPRSVELKMLKEWETIFSAELSSDTPAHRCTDSAMCLQCLMRWRARQEEMLRGLGMDENKVVVRMLRLLVVKLTLTCKEERTPKICDKFKKKCVQNFIFYST